MKRILQEYKSKIAPVWCPGCGDYGVLRALHQALADLDVAPEDIITVSGIGCSGRLSHYLNTYSLHGTHGRAVPTALGAKAARPDLTVIAVGGDGDGLGIGGGHIPHAARKNVDITYLLIDNRIYGLTKGQASPTTPVGQRTKTTPYGVYDHPLSAIPIFLAYDVSFIARASSVRVKELTGIVKQAISHKGMSIVYILSPCRTFPVLELKSLKSLILQLPDDHPREDKMKAMERAYSSDPIYTGIFYQIQKPTLEDHLQNDFEKACVTEKNNEKITIKTLMQSYI